MKTRMRFLPLFLVILIHTITACSPAGDDARTISTLDSLMRSAVKQELTAGAVLQVKKGERILHRKAYGYTQKYGFDGDLKPNPTEMTLSHHFDLASLTKVFATTLAIMHLTDKGKIDLDASVLRYLPGFTGPSRDSVTVRHLLSHTGGLYQWRPIYIHARDRHGALEYICSLPLKYPVGEERHYSDLGFMLLGYIVAEIGDEPLEEYLSNEIYSALGLERTGFIPKAMGLEGFAATSHGNPFEYRMIADSEFGYFCPEDPDEFNGWRNYTLVGEVNDGNAYYAHQGVAGHAGLFSTVSELQRLIDLLLAEGEWNGKQFLRKATVREFLTAGENGNGLGWAMDPKIIYAPGARNGTFGHTGFTGTSVVAVPARDLSIILLTNRQNVGLNSSGYYPDLGSLREQIFRSINDE